MAGKDFSRRHCFHHLFTTINDACSTHTQACDGYHRGSECEHTQFPLPNAPAAHDRLDSRRGGEGTFRNDRRRDRNRQRRPGLGRYEDGLRKQLPIQPGGRRPTVRIQRRVSGGRPVRTQQRLPVGGRIRRRHLAKYFQFGKEFRSHLNHDPRGPGAGGVFRQDFKALAGLRRQWETRHHHRGPAATRERSSVFRRPGSSRRLQKGTCVEGRTREEYQKRSRRAFHRGIGFLGAREANVSRINSRLRGRRYSATSYRANFRRIYQSRNCRAHECD